MAKLKRAPRKSTRNAHVRAHPVKRRARARAPAAPAAPEFLSLQEIVAAARRNLSQDLWNHLTGGADSETTLKRNRLALDSLALRQRDAAAVDRVAGELHAALAAAVDHFAHAAKHGLTPRARVVGMATVGVPPRIMGIGPAPATEKVLALTGLKLAQMDVIELNEAFAAQGLAVLRQLGLQDDDPRVNPYGGAIALGHPLGASGARLITTAMYQLHRTQGRYALCTMCIGVGQGIALIIERV